MSNLQTKRIMFKFNNPVIILVLAVLVTGCKKEEILNNHESLNDEEQQSCIMRSSDSDTTIITDGPIVLGDTIRDPYKLENMQDAYSNIGDESAPISSVEASHRYVRILPANRDELDAIESDTTLMLFDFPLHYEISVAGTYYHDPAVQDSTLTWLYCVVPINYQFPAGITEELVYYVYIPPTESKGDFYDRLEEEAYRLVGYEDEDGGSAKATNSIWIPSAYIKAWDDIANCQIPLEGVKVVANYVTKIGVGYTNGNGYCAVDKSFSHKVHYKIKWERGYWDIRNGAIGQAYYNGPKQKSAWDLEISKNGKSILYASAHRAAQKFYYGERLGLRRPNLSYGKTKIAVYDRNPWWGSGCCWGTWSLLGAIPDVIIAITHSASTDVVFCLAIHELGHQSHLLHVGKGTYIQIAKEIHESWASAIAWKLTNHHYNSDLGYVSYACSNNKQGWYPGNNGYGNTSCYTPIFIDLIDDFNQYGLTSDHDYPNDLISGYDIGYIQNNIITSSYGLSSLYTALINNKPNNNITNSQIDILMALYWGRHYTRN